MGGFIISRCILGGRQKLLSGFRPLRGGGVPPPPLGWLGPLVRDIKFFASKEVGWRPVFVTSRFCTKGGRLGPCVHDVIFLHQRRSIGPPCSWRNVICIKRSRLGPVFVTSRFCTKGGQLGPHVCDVIFFASKEVDWAPYLWRNIFCIKGGWLGPRVHDVTLFASK